LQEPLPWENSVLLNGDAVDAVEKVKNESEDDLTILGSGVLVRSLMTRPDLIDTFVLIINPLVLGSGTKLFDDGTEVKLELVHCTPTTTGALIATYRTVSPS
jgi:dihydrofolate reductase